MLEVGGSKPSPPTKCVTGLAGVVAQAEFYSDYTDGFDYRVEPRPRRAPPEGDAKGSTTSTPAYRRSADIATVDPADAVLPHQGEMVNIGDVVSARLIAARVPEDLPESIGFPWCADMRTLNERFGVGRRFARRERLGEDRGMGDEAQVVVRMMCDAIAGRIR